MTVLLTVIARWLAEDNARRLAFRAAARGRDRQLRGGW